VPTCLVHNCETSRGLLDFHLLSPLSQDQIPFDPHQWKAFECLKMAVTTAPVLISPQDSEPFRIEADSSDFASRAILSQQLPGEEK